MALSGYLTLGTAISGTAVVTPPGGTNYASQPVNYDTISGGVQLSSINCVFGPVSGSWGTLTCFGITDASGNALISPGTLQSPFTPANGQLVLAPPGSFTVVVGSQFAVGPGVVLPNTFGPTTSGYVSLASGAYSAVVASGTSRNLLQLQNTSASDTVSLIFGGDSAPASGAVPGVVLSSHQSWPPGGSNFTTTDSVWATCAAASGTVLSWMKG